MGIKYYNVLGMKAMAGFLLLVLGLVSSIQAQIALLEDFDFSKGDYTILVIPQSDNDDFDEGLMDTTVVVAYFDQKERLNQFKSNLVVDELEIGGGDLPRFPTHHLEVCKNGRSVHHIMWETPFGYICSPKGNYAFHGDFDFKDYKIARLLPQRYNDLGDARRCLDSLSRLPNLIYIPDPLWKDFEGAFALTLRIHNADKGSVLTECTAQIAALYPDQPFRLEVVTQSVNYHNGYSTYYLRVNCNRPLFDQFEIYEKVSGSWWQFPLYLRSYWKN